MYRTACAALLVCFSAALPAAAQTVSRDPAQAPSGTYAINESHTQLLFSLQHLGLTDYYGRFDKISGSLNWNGSHPEQSVVTVAIDTASIDMPSSMLTNQMKTLFRTQQFPAATFRSTSISRTGPDTGEITGMLTIRDVTKPVTLDATFIGTGKTLLGESHALGFRASATIRRSDFGLNSMIWSPMVSDEVHLIIEAMFDQS